MSLRPLAETWLSAASASGSCGFWGVSRVARRSSCREPRKINDDSHCAQRGMLKNKVLPHFNREALMGAIKVESGKVVVLSYVLKDEGGEIIDEATAADPFPYLHGAENIVPGLEAALTGKLVGDKFEAVVSPREGFGERIGEPQIVPRSAFPEGMPIEVGMQFIESDGESEMPVLIVGQQGDELLVVNIHH